MAAVAKQPARDLYNLYENPADFFDDNQVIDG
jgi:hypothetical protein